MRRLELMAVIAALGVAAPAVAQVRTSQPGTVGDWIRNGQGRVYTPAGQNGNGRVVNGQVVNGGILNGRVIDSQQCVQQTDRTGRVRTVCPTTTTTNHDRAAEVARMERQRRLERARQEQIALQQQQLEQERLARLERERAIERARERQREAQFDRQDHRQDDRDFDRSGNQHGNGRALGHFKNGKDKDRDDNHAVRAANRDEHGGHGRH